jgi:hypothetical protein
MTHDKLYLLETGTYPCQKRSDKGSIFSALIDRIAHEDSKYLCTDFLNEPKSEKADTLSFERATNPKKRTLCICHLDKL